jgi:predicted transcriptional regulator
MTEWQILLNNIPKPLELPKAKPRHKAETYRKLLQTPKTVDDLCAVLDLTQKGCLRVLQGMAERGQVRRVGKVGRNGSVGRSKVLWEWVK